MGRAGAGEASSSSNMTRSDGWTPETASDAMAPCPDCESGSVGCPRPSRAAGPPHTQSDGGAGQSRSNPTACDNSIATRPLGSQHSQPWPASTIYSTS